VSALADTSVLVDYCVAASALVNGMELWTLNVRHFPMFQRLRPPW
jgi:predicted nucleic acid-binding protein